MVHIFRIRLFLFVFLAWLAQSLQQREVNIGAIFFDDEIEFEKTFREAVKKVNNESPSNIRLQPIVRRLSPSEGGGALQEEACGLIENGVVAIFGPSSKAQSDIVSLICNSTGVPQILFDSVEEETSEEKVNHQMTVNIYPSQLILSKAYADIVSNFPWNKFTVVYDADDDQAPNRLQDLLQLRDVHPDVMRVRKFRKSDDFRLMWKSISTERRVILDCTPDILVELLNASIPFGITAQFNHIFLTNLETHTSDLEEFLDNDEIVANITAARLKLNDNSDNNNYWQRVSLDNAGESTSMPAKSIHIDLIYDAVNVFAMAIQNLTYLNPSRVQCDFSDYGLNQPWRMGRYINRAMKSISGVNNTNFRSSNLQFDEDGLRVNFNIEVYDLRKNIGLVVWDTKGQITPLQTSTQAIEKIIYRVATKTGEPYFMLKKDVDEREGNDRYEGFAVDLVKALSEELDFEYVFEPVKDDKQGVYNKDTKQWDGIIGELVNNDAHMGICDMTITQQRRQAVDFTVPFMQLGIGILAYKSAPVEKHVLAFLEPFVVEVWVYVMIAFFAMTLLLMFVARISEDEWENPHPCNKDPPVLENNWQLSNSFWLTAGSILTAGCDILPRSTPMRTFNAMWWIFAIIITNSYTANLAAFLTTQRQEGSINGIKSLFEQSEVQFGTMLGGSTYTFLSESNESTYRVGFNKMTQFQPSAFTATNLIGKERVISHEGGYMFLMETTTLEYYTERSCALEQVGEPFGDKHYGIAVPFNSPYRSNLSLAILHLSEAGELINLKKKWWKGDEECPEQEVASDTTELKFEHMRGIFYTLFIGVFLAVIVGAAEFLMYVQSLAVEEKATYKEIFYREIKFVLNFRIKRKAIRGTPTASLKSSSDKSSEIIRKSLKKSDFATASRRESEKPGQQSRKDSKIEIITKC